MKKQGFSMADFPDNFTLVTVKDRTAIPLTPEEIATEGVKLAGFLVGDTRVTAPLTAKDADRRLWVWNATRSRSDTGDFTLTLSGRQGAAVRLPPNYRGCFRWDGKAFLEVTEENHG